MSPLYLFATVAGTPVAIRGEEVEAVVRVDEVSPVPGMPAHVAGLAALRSRVLTMIDVAALIDGRAMSPKESRLAIVANIAGHSYGLIVDAVSDICAASGGELVLRGRIDPAWAPYAEAMVEHGTTPCLLVSLSSFVEPRRSAQAA